MWFVQTRIKKEPIGLIMRVSMKVDKGKIAVEAAIELFGDNGFDNTSTQSIAKHAGIGNATLFKYFPTKDVLIKEAYLSTKMETLRKIKQGLDPNASFESMLRTMWLNYIDWALKFPQKHKFVLQVHHSRFDCPEIEEKIQSEMLFFQLALNSAKQNKLIMNEDNEVIYALIMNFLNLAIEFQLKNSEISEIKFYQFMLRCLSIEKK
ncbi:MAG: TetR/AcrR family transcriptional regulator [Oligoflexales bacterium]